MDPYPIEFDCNDDHNYCGPPYLMNYSLNVSENIPNDTIVELVVMVKRYNIFFPIPCVDELPPLPPLPTRPPRTTTTTTPATTTTTTTTSSTTTTTPWTYPVF